MPLGAITSAPALAWWIGLVHQTLDGFVILHGRAVGGHRPAMTVAGVFAEAEIGDTGHREFGGFGPAQQFADDVCLVQRRRSRCIFLRAIDHAKDEISAKSLVRADLQPFQSDIDRHLMYAGHGCHFPANGFPLADKQRHDDVSAANHVPAQHLPKLRLLPQTAGTNGKIKAIGHAGYSTLPGRLPQAGQNHLAFYAAEGSGLRVQGSGFRKCGGGP
jgi:hypothetical protein